MLQNIGLTEDEIFDGVCEEGKIRGVGSEPLFFELIDEMVEDLRIEGALHSEQNIEGIAEHLKRRFSEYQDRLVA